MTDEADRVETPLETSEPETDGLAASHGDGHGKMALSRRKLLELGGLASLGTVSGMLFGAGRAQERREAAPTPDYQTPDTGVVPEGTAPDRRFRLVSNEASVVVDEGIVFQGMTFDSTIPSTLHRMNEGEVVEVEVENQGAVTHGLSYHPTYRSTPPKVGSIPPGQTKSELFKASYPGVFMYHCAPGGQGIPVHTIGGMYGMAVVEPTTTKYRLEQELGREPDVRVYLVQHELYASGLDAVRGQPIYTMFNGYNFRYVEDPIAVRPGDYVRMYYLNVGPNYASTLHMVGGIWDYMYYQGNPENVLVGGQSVVSGPADSWVVEFRIPEEGPYPLVSHAFGTQALRGALAMFQASNDAERVPEVLSKGPSIAIPESPKRIVNTFAPGTPDVDPVRTFRDGEDARVQMIGNSFVPKTIRVAPGTPITWINEDVFDYLSGEQTGQHNVVVTSGPEIFASTMLSHADSWTKVPTMPGEYEYFCALHPYMIGRIIVDPDLPQPS